MNTRGGCVLPLTAQVWGQTLQQHNTPGSTHIGFFPTSRTLLLHCAVVWPPERQQIDYLQPTPRANVVTAAQKLNQAIAWMYTAQAAQAPRLGLGNCVWVMDDATATGGIACVSAANQRVASVLGLPANAVVAAAGRRLQQAAGPGAAKRSILVPANPALRLRIFAAGKLRKEVKGTAGQAQLLDLSTTATDLQVSWV